MSQACVITKGHEGVPGLDCLLSHCVELTLPFLSLATILGRDDPSPSPGSTVEQTLMAGEWVSFP